MIGDIVLRKLTALSVLLSAFLFGASFAPASAIETTSEPELWLPSAIPVEVVDIATGAATEVRGVAPSKVANNESLNVIRENADVVALKLVDTKGEYPVLVTNVGAAGFVVEIFDESDDMALTALEIAADHRGRYEVVAIPQDRVAPLDRNVVSENPELAEFLDETNGHGFFNLAICWHTVYYPWRTYSAPTKAWATSIISSCNQPATLTLQVHIQKYFYSAGTYLTMNYSSAYEPAGWSLFKSVSDGCLVTTSYHPWRTKGAASASWATGGYASSNLTATAIIDCV